MMDVKELKKSYYHIITELWALYREDLQTVQDIKSADDPRWANICDRYEKLVADAPAGVRDYAALSTGLFFVVCFLGKGSSKKDL